MGEPRDHDAFRLGEWTVEPALNLLSRDGQDVSVEPRSIAVLGYLAARQGEVVSTDELIRAIWNDRPMGDNPVYKCIAQLRRALDDDAQSPRYIATIPRKGYRLIAAVSPVQRQRAAEVPPRSSVRAWLALPIAALGILVLASFIRMQGAIPTDPEPTRNADAARTTSLVILPFGDDQADPGNGISGVGIALEVSRRLLDAPGLRIISLDSAIRAGYRQRDAQSIARQLNVDHVLVGDVGSHGDRIVIDTRLVGASGDELWQARYEREAPALLTMIGQLARDVSNRLDLPENAALTDSCGGTTDLAACRLFLMAQLHVSRRDPERLNAAVEILHRAIRKDPAFASAHATLGIAYLLGGGERERPAARERAEIAINHALELDADLADAHAALGLLEMSRSPGHCPVDCLYTPGYEASERALLRALEANPGLAYARNWLAIATFGQGRLSEAFAQLEHALRYDPLNPVVNYNHALYRARQGDIDGARQHLEEFLRYPDPPPFMHGLLARLENRFGRYDEALRLWQPVTEKTQAPGYIADHARSYIRLGLFNEATEFLGWHTDTLVDPVYSNVQLELLVAAGDRNGLDEFAQSLRGQASEFDAPIEQWPRWLTQVLGRTEAALGHHEVAVKYLRAVHGRWGEYLNHGEIDVELDAVHALAGALRALGDQRGAATVLDNSLVVIHERKAQGQTGYPALTLAEARAYALQGRTALAIGTFRQAVDQGWRDYWSIQADPRWDAVRQELDFDELVAQVRQDLEHMRNGAEPGFRGTAMLPR